MAKNFFDKNIMTRAHKSKNAPNSIKNENNKVNTLDNKINCRSRTIHKVETHNNKEKKANMFRQIINKPVRLFKDNVHNITQTINKSTKCKRSKLPFGLRSNVWTKYNGEVFNAKCYVKFCNQTVTPFTFEVGHNVPVSKGGCNSITNLRPICRNCNMSMSNNYTIDEYSKTFE